MKIGIIGNGFVGKATRLLEGTNEIIVYDINPSLCYPVNLKFEDLSTTDIVFICVPTPMEKTGKPHLEIVYSVVNMLKKLNGNFHIIIKSTVPPGTSEKLGVHFMPEFLTENNWKCDFVNQKEWILGISNTCKNSDKVQEVVQKCFSTACNDKKIKYDKLIVMKSKEAELTKYFKNSFLAVKVSFCNEIYDYCQLNNIDYNKVVSTATLDGRISKSHTVVPGPDGKRGYGGTCFPKDIQALLYEFKKLGLESFILESSQRRNIEKDRVEQDWNRNKGRSVI